MRTLHTIGVCGAGQMGAAAAVYFQRASYRVLLWARNPSKLPAIQDTVSHLDNWMTEHIGPAPCSGGAIEVTSNLNEIDEQADLVLDCIAEVMAEKVELFQQLIKAQQRETIFITSTSGLSITEMARESGLGARLVGAHFWNPPHLMPLVEVIRGEETDEATAEDVYALMESIGKIPVRVNRDVPGFIGNRLQHALWREAISLVQNGIASAEDVDRVARLTFGLRLPAVGPLENMDLVGLDLVHNIHGYLMEDIEDEHRPMPMLEQLVEADQLGMKSGQGFYNWNERDPNALIERRDRQIVRQLEYLKQQNAL